MDDAQLQQRISRISTQWSMMQEAHGSQQSKAAAARSVLAQRYIAAVYRYVLAIVRDADLADELCQEMSLKFLAGEFHRATPERGRFRDYLKTVVVNLVRSHHRAAGKRPKPLPEHLGESPAAPGNDDGPPFIAEWRREVLEQTWQALNGERENYYHVLRLRVENPDMSSAELAAQYAAQRGGPMTAANVRKILERAHRKFAALLVDEVAGSLSAPTRESVDAELRELDLLKYCQSAFEDWASRHRATDS